MSSCAALSTPLSGSARTPGKRIDRGTCKIRGRRDSGQIHEQVGAIGGLRLAVVMADSQKKARCQTNRDMAPPSSAQKSEWSADPGWLRMDAPPLPASEQNAEVDRR